MKIAPKYEVVKTVVENKVRTGVTLELSDEDAKNLVKIIGSIAGRGRLRATVDSLYQVLRSEYPMSYDDGQRVCIWQGDRDPYLKG